MRPPYSEGIRPEDRTGRDMWHPGTPAPSLRFAPQLCTWNNASNAPKMPPHDRHYMEDCAGGPPPVRCPQSHDGVGAAVALLAARPGSALVLPLPAVRSPSHARGEGGISVGGAAGDAPSL